tara:strand:- start:308 stop:604 length:297 start_codon:yes stop_codon:yes gene_type:complete
MGYIKLKKASGFDLVCADNIGDIKLDTATTGDSIAIQYLGQCKVVISAGSAADLVQADVDTIANAVDVMNGASGKAPLTELSQPVDSVTMSVLPQATS